MADNTWRSTQNREIVVSMLVNELANYMPPHKDDMHRLVQKVLEFENKIFLRSQTQQEYDQKIHGKLQQIAQAQGSQHFQTLSNQNQPSTQSRAPINQNLQSTQFRDGINQTQPSRQVRLPINQNQKSTEFRAPMIQNQRSAPSRVPRTSFMYQQNMQTNNRELEVQGSQRLVTQSGQNAQKRRLHKKAQKLTENYYRPLKEWVQEFDMLSEMPMGFNVTDKLCHTKRQVDKIIVFMERCRNSAPITLTEKRMDDIENAIEGLLKRFNRGWHLHIQSQQITYEMQSVVPQEPQLLHSSPPDLQNGSHSIQQQESFIQQEVYPNATASSQLLQELNWNPENEEHDHDLLMQ